MGRACCVLGCPSGGNVPSHQFPKDPVLAHKWRTMIYSEKVKHLTDEQIKRCAVCYRHFTDDDYLVTYKVRKLKRGVTPSLNLPNNLSVDDSEIDVKQEISKTEMEIDIDTNMFVTRTHTIRSLRTDMEVPQTTDIILRNDIEEINSSLAEHSQQYLTNNHVNETDTTVEEFKLYCKLRALRRKRARLTTDQLILLQRKKQADRYTKTPIIQKLLSLLTPTQKLSVQNKIKRSKYSPKIYVNIYHDIAKRIALGEL